MRHFLAALPPAAVLLCSCSAQGDARSIINGDPPTSKSAARTRWETGALDVTPPSTGGRANSPSNARSGGYLSNPSNSATGGEPNPATMSTAGGATDSSYHLATGGRASSTLAKGGAAGTGVQISTGGSSRFATNSTVGGTAFGFTATSVALTQGGNTNARSSSVSRANTAAGGVSSAMTRAAGGANGPTMPANGCTSETRVLTRSGACVDRFREFAVDARPSEIAVDSQGMIWFDDESSGRIVRIDTEGKTHATFSAPQEPAGRRLIRGTGDTLVWFTSASTNALWRVNSALKAVEISLPVAPHGVASGPGNNLWVTDLGDAKGGTPPSVTQVTPTGAVALSIAASPTGPIAVGPDGSVWFSEDSFMCNATTAGEVTRYPLLATAWVTDICAGTDRAIWFSDGILNQIARFDAERTMTGYGLGDGVTPQRIVLGPDDALWFTSPKDDTIGRIALQNQRVTQYLTPTRSSAPSGIALGLDGNLWFTERLAGKIGRLTPDP